MKRKSFKLTNLLLAVSIGATMLSCTNDSIENSHEMRTTETASGLANKIGKFRSDEEKRISSEFKSFATGSTSNNVEKNAIFYHDLKLKSVYKERETFKFTSLQNLADEINFLVLFDKEKAENLFQKYSNYLRKSIYTVEPTLDYETAITTDINELSTIKSDNSTGKYIGVVSVKEGVLLSNGVYNITWHVGVEKHKDDIGLTFYRNFTQLGSNAYVNGQWVLYPSSMRPALDAYAEFFGSGIGEIETLGFLSDYGSVIRNTGGKQNYVWKPSRGKIGGTFTTTVNGNEYKLEGASNFQW
ncbi:hypothetical protein [Chryseobacterium culicis]|jgi:hypothetical protein|uniref:DUF4848 domain-containing protein n=2 Tax=Chryseobacterium culicis TaxID=680127 RepID=A0A1H6GZ91_CHRCI|nr:hypothetical protein [Chryseobacterium culicis]SEH27143.1 hypothetical protein SAMN05421593_0211 [Chryseobacterium culicis]